MVVVTGTGTGIGKTHVSEALLRAIALLGRRVAGLKPVETGVGPGVRTDAARLEAVSTFHVKPSPEPEPLLRAHPSPDRAPYTFPQPISPHLAAREAGAPAIRVDAIRDYVDDAAATGDFVLVELAGGLFSPISDNAFNADVAARLAPDVTLLVAPDRLGVLHDVFAALRAACTVPLGLDAILLSAPETRDASTGRNGPEIRRLAPQTPVFELPRADPATLASDPALRALLREFGPRLGL